ncbi:anti-sigma-factor antagonist [Chloroherpeton thalassium ATCC 35110]|uniref:Anti-sigma factor antagonist n=1 Tax=Chloroherpeton thalassium (strain ATCC 35110 / GB-78) TaxID=517418 RepID=B3QTE9_CHLT3|nr:STAS domain-containing protein [Chloroherpeton thalassium]ACF12695.1 anti-sigma-factor antagonist [Chloroherpeton thalassium ATCC 35110]
MSNFNCTLRTIEEFSILDLSGDLDAHTASILEKKFQELIENKSFKIVVTFSNLNYISSAGLGVFMGVIEDIRSGGGDIKFSNTSDNIYQVFDMLGFPLLYEFFDDESEAIEKFKTSNVVS